LQRENVARGGERDDIGCNWRRARVGDQSMDGLSVKNPADGRYYLEDVIASAGSPSASIKYHHPFRERPCCARWLEVSDAREAAFRKREAEAKAEV
jgi:hypothetical protein